MMRGGIFVLLVASQQLKNSWSLNQLPIHTAKIFGSKKTAISKIIGRIFPKKGFVAFDDFL